MGGAFHTLKILEGIKKGAGEENSFFILGCSSLFKCVEPNQWICKATAKESLCLI